MRACQAAIRPLGRSQASSWARAGGRTVSLGSVLGPEFAAAPALLFGPDQFHPSADGYRQLAGVLIPSTLAALGLGPADEELPEAFRGEGVMPVAAAAARAVNVPGTELDGTEVSGWQRGLRGRWVELRRRRRRPGGETESPETSEGEAHQEAHQEAQQDARAEGVPDPGQHDAGPSSEDERPAEMR